MTDPRSINLGPHAEDAWLRLRHHLGWSQGFALGFLFVANPRLADAFRWRLERAYLGRVSTLQTLKPASPDLAIDEIMRLVRESPALLDDMAAPLWIELHEHAGDKAWDRARTLVLARLNEHRELLRRRLGRPLILILPQGWQAQARQIAPDLWFIRDFSLDVAAAATSIADEPSTVVKKSPVVAAEPSKSGWRRLLRKLWHPSQPRFPDHPLVAEWRRVRRKDGSDPNVLNTGWRAIDFLLDQRRIDEAYAIANEVLALTRQGSESDPRSLSVSLNKVGDAAHALGRLEDAERAYAESLAVMRVLRERLGDTPQVLRDLSVSLNKVGDAASALGQLEEARNAYQEAATLLRRLDHVFPGQEYASWLTDVEAKYQATASAQAQGSGDHPS